MDAEIKVILLIINETGQRNKLKSLLEPAGYQLVCCRDGAEAIRALQHQPFDLILTEIELKGLDGWRLARMIRSGVFRSAADTPLIALYNQAVSRILSATAVEFGFNLVLSEDKLELLLPQLQKLDEQGHIHCQKPRLLVVEDTSDTAFLIERILGNRFDIDLASDGEQGLLLWQKHRHQLVLLDVMLPNLSGETVLTRILSQDPSQAVVIMTAYSTMELAGRLMLTGACDFLEKPFRAEQLRRICELASRREDYLASHREFREQLNQLQQSQSRYQQVSQSYRFLLDNLGTVVLELDRNGLLRFVNPSWARLTGYSAEESCGQPLCRFLAADSALPSPSFEQTLQEFQLGSQLQLRLELKLQAQTGNQIWVELKLDRVPDSSLLLGCLEDISARKMAEKELEHMALHDSLTSIHNRRYFDLRLQELTEQEGPHVALYLDLDYFKLINDTLGHHQGDIALQQIASLLASCLQPQHSFCRIGGDEFAILLPRTSLVQGEQLAERMLKTLNEHPWQLAGRSFELGCSIGLSLIDGQSREASDYWVQADRALYVAKSRGRNQIHVYDPADTESEELRSDQEWLRSIRRAIEFNQLELFLQPALSLNTGQVEYYEALCRLRAEDGRILTPDHFIPSLERCGEAPRLDVWVIGEAFRLLQDMPGLTRIGINLSGQSLSQPEVLSKIERLLKQTGIDPDRLVIELTESASLKNRQQTEQMIDDLHRLGCHFAIDDFGAGFSTFSYLKDLPSDYIKLDGSFIRNVDRDPVDQALARAIIEVARVLGKKTIAEFVQNQASLELLQEMGVDCVQGYHILHPSPARDALANMDSKLESKVLEYSL